MLPYLIAGAIGFGIGKLFEEGGETFMAGGMTNEDILRSFLTSERETQTNNLATFYSTLGGVMLLRNYRTFIAKRMGNKVKISSQKYSQTTSKITNRLKALAEKMGYSVEYVTEKEIYNFDEFGRGRQVKVADFNPKSEKEYDIKEFTEIAIKKYSKQYDEQTIKKEINRNKDWYDYTNETQLNNDLRGLLENLRILEVIKKKIKYTNKKYKINDTFNVEFYILFNDEQDAYNPNTLNKPSGYYLQFMTNDVSEFDEIFDEINTNNDKKITISYDEDALSIIMPLFETKSETPTNYKKAIQEGNNKIPVLTEYFVKFLDEFSDSYYGDETFMAGGNPNSWSVSDLSDGKYLGYIEFQDNEGEYHNFEIMETDDRLVFGGMTNTGFIESGYIEKDGFSTDETLQSLIEDLEVYYNDGAEYTSQIVFNERMENGGEASEKYILRRGTPIRKNIRKKRPKTREPKMVRTIFEEEYFKDFDNGGEADDVEQNFKVGNIVELSESGWDNENYHDFFEGVDNVKLVITYVYTNKSQHQGFDEGVGMALYSTKRFDNNEIVPFDLYDYELEYVSKGKKFADGGEAGEKLISIARAIFNPNEDNGKIATSFGKKTFDGFVEMIKQNDAYDIYYNIWQENAEGKYIATTYGDKTYIGLLEMLKSAKNEDEYAEGGSAKKRRRSASIQYGRSNTAVDKTRDAKPVGYRFTNAKASELRKDPYDEPTEAQIKKYLGKGIYKENRKRHSDKDRDAKL